MTNKLDIYEFSRQLITTNDLDPTYVMLHQAQLPPDKLCRWLLAYLCYYHCGTACWIADVPTLDEYWKRMTMAAGSKDYPRSSERRHFRGETSRKAVAKLCIDWHQPTALFSYIAFGSTCSSNVPFLSDVLKRVQELYGFGLWVSFKAADIIERLGIAPIKFEPTDVFNMFKSPREGAEAMNKWYNTNYTGNYCYTWAYNSLYRKLGVLKAPPRYERRVNIQELESCFCKWHSHINGHYEVGKDIKEVKHGLELFKSRSSLAKDLLAAGQKGDLW